MISKIQARKKASSKSIRVFLSAHPRCRRVRRMDYVFSHQTPRYDERAADAQQQTAGEIGQQSNNSAAVTRDSDVVCHTQDSAGRTAQVCFGVANAKTVTLSPEQPSLAVAQPVVLT